MTLDVDGNGRKSQWAGHFKFGSWLTQTKKPNVIVDLGTFTGVSAISFFMGHPAARVVTIDKEDFWEGDERFNKIERHIGLFDDYVSDFDDRSIDILHIDGDHKYLSVLNDFTKWIPKLKRDGVLLMHDTFNPSFFGPMGVFHAHAKEYRAMFLTDCGLGISTKDLDLYYNMLAVWGEQLVKYPIIETLHRMMYRVARKV